MSETIVDAVKHFQRRPLAAPKDGAWQEMGIVIGENVEHRYMILNEEAQKALTKFAGGVMRDGIQCLLKDRDFEDSEIHWNAEDGEVTFLKKKVVDATIKRESVTIVDIVALHQSTCDAARGVIVAKNHDYTDGSVDPFANFRTCEILGVPAELGVLVRLLDKVKRIQTFVNKGTLKVKNESVNDAIEDSINYLVLLKGIISQRCL